MKIYSRLLIDFIRIFLRPLVQVRITVFSLLLVDWIVEFIAFCIVIWFYVLLDERLFLSCSYYFLFLNGSLSYYLKWHLCLITNYNISRSLYFLLLDLFLLHFCLYDFILFNWTYFFVICLLFYILGLFEIFVWLK